MLTDAQTYLRTFHQGVLLNLMTEAEQHTQEDDLVEDVKGTYSTRGEIYQIKTSGDKIFVPTGWDIEDGKRVFVFELNNSYYVEQHNGYRVTSHRVGPETNMMASLTDDDENMIHCHLEKKIGQFRKPENYRIKRRPYPEAAEPSGGDVTHCDKTCKFAL